MATKRKVTLKARKGARKRQGSQSLPWASPEVETRLLHDLDVIADRWFLRSASLPSDPTSRCLARILTAVSHASRIDREELGELEARALDLLERHGLPVVRRTRHAECERLKAFFGDPNQPSGRGWLHHMPAHADWIDRVREGLARHFVVQVLSDESFFVAEFSALGVCVDPFDTDARAVLVERVTSEFCSVLTRSEIASSPPDVEKLIRRGLVAMGYPLSRAKDLFGFENIRAKRRWKRSKPGEKF